MPRVSSRQRPGSWDCHLRQLRSVDKGIGKLLQLQGFGQGSTEPSEEVRKLAAEGRKVEAMRQYREQCGADVRQAEKVVDQLAAAAAIDKT